MNGRVATAPVFGGGTKGGLGTSLMIESRRPVDTRKSRARAMPTSEFNATRSAMRMGTGDVPSDGGST